MLKTAIKILNNPSVARLIGQSLISGGNLVIALATTYFMGAIVFGAFSFMLLFANLGLNISKSLFVEPATVIAAKMDKTERSVYFSNLFFIFIGMIVLLVMPLHFSLDLAAKFFFDNTQMDILIATAFIIAFIAVELLRAGFQAFASSIVVLVFDSMRVFLSLAFLLIVIFSNDFYPSISDLHKLFFSQLLAFTICIAAIGFLFIVRGNLYRPNFSDMNKHRKIGLQSATVTGIRFFQVNSPAYWTQFLLGEEIFGIVRASQSVANFVSLPANALRLNLMAEGANRFAQDGGKAMTKYIFKMARNLSLLSVILSILLLGVLLLAPEPIRQSGETVMIIICFILFNISVVTNSAINTYFYSRGELSPLLVRSIIGLILASLLAPILLIQMGGIGMPLAQLCSSIVLFVITFWYIKSRL